MSKRKVRYGYKSKSGGATRGIKRKPRSTFRYGFKKKTRNYRGIKRNPRPKR